MPDPNKHSNLRSVVKPEWEGSLPVWTNWGSRGGNQNPCERLLHLTWADQTRATHRCGMTLLHMSTFGRVRLTEISLDRPVGTSDDAPAPPPPPDRVEVALRPQVFLVESYRLTTRRTAMGKGSLIGSIPFLPGAQKVVTISQSVTRSTQSVITTTAMESSEKSDAENFNSHVASASERSGSKEPEDYSMHANFHGDASLGISSGEANAQLDVQGGSNSVRNSFGDSVENAADQQVAKAAATRRQKVSTEAQDSTNKEEWTTVSTETVKNPNPTHTVNYLYYQCVDEFTSFLSLVDVQVAFPNTDAAHANDRQVPLSRLDELLNSVLLPERVPAVRDAITQQLKFVLDFQIEPTSIIEEVPVGGDRTMVRLKKDLHTAYTMRHSDGKPLKKIAIDGLVVRVFKKRIPSNVTVVDTVVGKVSAR